MKLTRKNVYVLPSRPGLLYGAVLTATMIASINYALSLGLMLTFLMGAVAIVAVFHTWRNLASIRIRPGRADPVFAGQPLEFSVLLVNPAGFVRHALQLDASGASAPTTVDLRSGTEQLVKLAVPARKRGWMPLPRVRLWTEFPLGLWRAWSWWRPDSRVLIYPAPETPAVALPPGRSAASDAASGGAGDEDVAAVRPYRPGDTSRSIAWKAVARTASDELLYKHFEGGERGELRLDWERLPHELDVESRISRLTRWVIDADASGARWALVLPDRAFPADSGPAHRDRCLRALAELDA